MAPSTVFVMRHGESLANQAGEIVSDPLRGVLGFGLSERGRAQVHRQLAAHPGLAKVTRIYCSDFLRAHQTALEVRAGLDLGLPVCLEPRLRERFFGAFEGGPVTAYEEVWRRDRAHPDEPGDGIEPAAAVAVRAQAVVRELAPGAGPVLLVCHGDVAQILLATASGLPPHRHRELAPLETAGVRLLRDAQGPKKPPDWLRIPSSAH